MRGYKLVFLVLFLWLTIFTISNLKKSVFLSKKERINILFYGKKTVVFSLGLGNNLTYLITYPTDLYLEVPGGYGLYRVGGLGKLVALEKKPEMFKKTFSSANSFFLDLYFYPKKEEIYHQESRDKKIWPSFWEIFYYQSSANFLDRVFCFYYFSLRRPLVYKLIEINKRSFDRDNFFKKNQGLFYKKKYRQENLTVQILYKKNFQVANLISKILEGEGIRVVDISQKRNDSNKECVVFYSSEKKSKTVFDIAFFFKCVVKNKETPFSDIIINLGSIEESWWVSINK